MRGILRLEMLLLSGGQKKQRGRRRGEKNGSQRKEGERC